MPRREGTGNSCKPDANQAGPMKVKIGSMKVKMAGQPVFMERATNYEEKNPVNVKKCLIM